MKRLIDMGKPKSALKKCMEKYAKEFASGRLKMSARSGRAGACKCEVAQPEKRKYITLARHTVEGVRELIDRLLAAPASCTEDDAKGSLLHLFVTALKDDAKLRYAAHAYLDWAAAEGKCTWRDVECLRSIMHYNVTDLRGLIERFGPCDRSTLLPKEEAVGAVGTEDI